MEKSMHAFFTTYGMMLDDLANQNVFAAIAALIGSFGLAVYFVLAPFRVTAAIRRTLKRRAHRKQVEGALAAVIAELPSLKQRLLEVQRQAQHNALDAIVAFFNATSPWHDRGLYRIAVDLKSLALQQYEPTAENIDKLAVLIQRCGRDRYGWNRTEKGELVTSDHVYLGNIYGYFTKTVTFWKAGVNEPKGQHGYAQPGNYFWTRNSYDIVSDQARGFIDEYTPLMMPLIDELVRQASPVRRAA